ncbi:PP2C family protein-serine/threonine phosphatase [Kineococcus rubinsiae]|uniref:PP2C family protein-serine/threonine phosphatase n=1 Tax=Kineococcus rubinsiae TaxID=2609562 RepID=UPI0014300EA8|nr:SpoIIE family protein phosphatase [Kineococcus rubinsiae]NIZ90487.1 SpoIIE family protein phosphatase [Kineococcus rubinsiae]
MDLRRNRLWRPALYAGHFSLTRRLAVVSAVLVTGLVGTGAGIAVTVRDLDRAHTAQSKAAEARQTLLALQARYVDAETGLRGYQLTADDPQLLPFERAQREVPELTRQLSAEVAATGVRTSLVVAVDSAFEQWLRYAGVELAKVPEAGPLDRAANVGPTNGGRYLFDALRDRVDETDESLAEVQEEQRQRTVAMQRRLVAVLVAALAVLLVAVVGGCTLLWRSVTSPLTRLARATRAVASGDHDAEIPEGGAPEVRSLAADVQAMRNRLTADLHRTEEAMRALGQTGPAVDSLRRALQPSGQDVAGVEVVGRLDAAEGVLAGDWYDTVRISPTRFGLVLGDVAGHGPVSAVFALRLKHSLATALMTVRSPGAALTQVSRQLGDVPDELFATVLVLTVDTTTGVLTYASAGHPEALLLRATPDDPGPLNPRERTGRLALADGTGASYVELPPTGPLLSPIVSGWAWTDVHHTFRPGTSLLAYTDGVLEARDAAGVEFGVESVLLTVEAAGLADAPRLLDAIVAAAVRHGHQERRDDQTLVHLRAVRRTAATGVSGSVRVAAPRSR